MDNIRAKVLKIINEYIAIPLEYIFNLSFSTGIPVVLDLLKIAEVVPIKSVKGI